MKVETLNLPKNLKLAEEMLCIKRGKVIKRKISHWVFACPMDKGVEMIQRGINPPLQAIPCLHPNEWIGYDNMGRTMLFEKEEKIQVGAGD